MTLRKKLMPLYLFNRGMVLASVYDLIYNVCGMLGLLLGPISGLYLVSYLFEHKTEIRNSTHQAQKSPQLWKA
ncbi:hypothetical protein [Mediterraneibacter faecis]|uniref:hypothetical protein n=2 Tax=Lachnospiraceae TaxID=186803 RepID=UPI0032BFECF3